MADENMTDDEIATQQAASGAPETVADPKANAGDPIKDWYRANVRWVMAEIGYTQSGHSEEERARLNP